MRPSFISRTSNLQKKTKRTIQLIFLSTQNKKENQLQPLNRLEDEIFSLGSIPVFLNLEQRVIRNYSLLKRSSCQVLSQSKARVEPVETSRFPALDVSCKYFLGVMLCSIHCLRPLIGQTYFLTLSVFPANLHLRLKNYSVRHFHTYPFHPRCYGLHTDQI